MYHKVEIMVDDEVFLIIRDNAFRNGFSWVPAYVQALVVRGALKDLPCIHEITQDKNRKQDDEDDDIPF